MINVTSLPTEERTESRRRLHLRDITSDIPLQIDTVGAELRAARTRRGEDLRTIAQTLRIRREHLEALEEGRDAALPGRAYAIGFVRSYAEHLGLDSTHIVERYKVELDGNEEVREELPFPKLSRETRLPRGSLLIVGVVIAAGIYGGWLLTHSADRMMTERVPPVPEHIEARATGSAGSADERPVATSLSGDPASAATRPSAPAASMTPVYAVPPSPVATAPEGAAAGAGETQTAAVAPAEVTSAAPEAPTIQPLPPLPAGQAFGSENIDGRVVVRARKNDAWIRVEDAQGHVLIERTLALGDSYRAPGKPGVILVARDASAFELLVDGASLGLAGPPTLVLTGKSLDPADLVAALPKPLTAEAAPVPADGAAEAAAAPAAGASRASRAN
ncbi:MAG: RodZ domain-containing protein [Parvibaculum sp.]|uniref:helix-turn-helix domain-containing protein n=1 Tax=Parvibaculum sp. TaxID=2024848 RepID=UPI003C789CEE